MYQVRQLSGNWERVWVAVGLFKAIEDTHMLMCGGWGTYLGCRSAMWGAAAQIISGFEKNRIL